MRLLDVDTLEFTEFRNGTPPYVVASHRWQDEEVSFRDVRHRWNTHGRGYKKVEDFAKYIQEHVQPVKCLWIDTCCIDKDSAAELSEG